jgi:hypothetical protein
VYNSGKLVYASTDHLFWSERALFTDRELELQLALELFLFSYEFGDETFLHCFLNMFKSVFHLSAIQYIQSFIISADKSNISNL